MPLSDGLVYGLASLIVVGFVCRAVWKLLRNSETPHRELVLAWERRLTTVAGIPLSLVGASTLVDGPLAVPYDPLMLLFAGVVLLTYPEFARPH
ncbi:hypothetical protein [Natrinema amylolyticum]|uniref:hypothetical protein n=1 Tax=Natrinema amylolyticum TaxID=2878679 RepID=UPI001CFC0909|nr:hypothetical protein [Natrinema amylolyticum]